MPGASWSPISKQAPPPSCSFHSLQAYTLAPIVSGPVVCCRQLHQQVRGLAELPAILSACDSKGYLTPEGWGVLAGAQMFASHEGVPPALQLVAAARPGTEVTQA